jgi:AhpD family alkylhydroperoxidase
MGMALATGRVLEAGASQINGCSVCADMHAHDLKQTGAGDERVFATIREAGLEGIRYVSSRLSDGVTFVALLEVAEGVENPLRRCPRPSSSRPSSGTGSRSRRPPRG